MYLHRPLILLIMVTMASFNSKAQSIITFEVNDYPDLPPANTSLNSVNKISLKTGVTLEFHESGKADGIPVIFLHGFTDSRHSFNYLLPYLSDDIRAIVITQRGHGGSDKPQTGYRPEDFAADLNAFMEAQNISRAVITGHSMGSTIAECFALNYPEKVSALVLLSTIPDFKTNPVIKEFGSQVSLLKDPIDHAFASEFQKSTITVPIPESFLDTLINETLKVPSVVWKDIMHEMQNADYSKRLKKIKTPTLLFYGEKDQLSSVASQERLMSKFKNAQLVVYPGVGHALHWETPSTIGRDISSFAKIANKN